MKKVPDDLIKKVVSLDYYFKKLSASLFFHCKKTKMIEIGPDNPCEKVPVTTDYKLSVWII